MNFECSLSNQEIVFFGLIPPLSCSHIMEHLEGVIEKPEKDMTPHELQLHYFKMHDYDGNNLLDGLELATAITHVHREVGAFVFSVFHNYLSKRGNLLLSAEG